MPSAWAVFLVLGATGVVVWHRLLAYLRYFQQEGYETLRFLRWTHVRSLTDPTFWLSMACVWWLSRSSGAAVVVFVLGCGVFARVQPDPRRSGKISLKLTWRATRVLSVAALLSALIWLALFAAAPAASLPAALLASALLFATLPVSLIAANAVLSPYERRVQQGYEADAIARIGSVKPFIIGITGSYGKSSAKAMLAHLLQFDAPTLAASGSINTLMGVTRHIREELVFGHKYMVVEMGAFKTGSIQRLCQLTPPSAGLITAVGDMHLERFGSTDEIVRAKSELARAIPPGGALVVNADSPGALRIARDATHCRVLLYGEASTDALATRVGAIRFSAAGTSFTLTVGDVTYACETPLLGRPIIMNLAGVFTLATALGVDPEIAMAAFRTLRPVSNRLEVVTERGVTWIRDAYNSNQFGFRAALEVAAALPVAKRVLVTPGCIELGPKQAEVNRSLAREAAEICDTIVVVSDTNREAFAAGCRDARREDRLVALPNRTEAFRWLRDAINNGDAVILENDLPDLYERTAGLFWPASAHRAARRGAA